MKDTKIEPDKIKTPIQLLVIWLIGLVVLVSGFITASTISRSPEWLNSMYGITAVLLIPIFIGLIFILQTKFRPELLGDDQYLEHKKLFKNFAPENVMPIESDTRVLKNTEISKDIEHFQNLEKERKNIYKQNQGIFLVHEWRPSTTKGQKADIVIYLVEHPNQKLTKGKVKSVEYELGRMFFDTTVIKTNEEENFKLNVSAYAGMLCIAKVTLNNDQVLTLTRYINFDE